jgi:hypothetical protein
MVEANVKILQDVRWFLYAVCDHTVHRALFTEKPTDFTRTRDLPMVRVIAMIVNLLKRSLSVEIREFFEVLVGKDPPTKSAFCQQRQKLKALFFQVWNHVLAEGFYRYYAGAVKHWRGFCLLACDGSTLYLPATPSVQQHFGTQRNQHGGVPMARALQLRDVLNELTLWAGLYPIHCGEGTILLENLKHIGADSLLLLDRGYPGFVLMYALGHQPSPLHFVMRCRVGFNQQVSTFMSSTLTDQVVTLRASPEARTTLRKHGYQVPAPLTLAVRMVKVPLAGGGTEVLLTSLLDQRLYSTRDLQQLYGLRWNIETAYNTQKNQLQLEQFSGVSVCAIEQDYHACVFVENLQTLIEKQCSDYTKKCSAKRKHPCGINTNCCWAALKHKVVRLLLTKDPLPLLLLLETIFEQYLEPIRAGRTYKRKHKLKCLNGKYHTLTNYKRAI